MWLRSQRLIVGEQAPGAQGPVAAAGGLRTRAQARSRGRRLLLLRGVDLPESEVELCVPSISRQILNH